MSELLLRTGFGPVTPESAGWRYLSFRVVSGAFAAEAGEEEVALVPLAGRARVEADGESWEVGGRESVFGGMPWALYLPRDTAYRLEADGEVAVCGARCERRREPVLVRPEDVEVEVRGAGNATRQINHIVKPEFPAERLLVVEVFTPSGNWSSYPPHKHDEDHPPDEVVLEETYYFRTAEPEAFAVQRLYSPRHGLDLTATVRGGDLLVVPYGYHTTAAAHGYDLYYLNALAGDRRSMAAADDPALHWVRAAWAELEPDPRVPLVR
jgi:5-deoxy-glucuronate isomerase